MLLCFLSLLVNGALFPMTQDPKPYQEQQLRKSLTKVCGSNCNTVSSWKLGRVVWKWAGKNFNYLLFWMKDSVGSEKDPQLVSRLFFFSDISFPTQSAIIYQGGTHLLHFLCRWVKILPLVECPPGARHWVELNIFILLFYLSLRSWEVKRLDLPIESTSKWQRKIQTLVCPLQYPGFLCLSWLEAQIMDQVKGNVLRAMKIANIVNDKSVSVISKSNSFCSSWSLFDCKTINVNYFSKCLEITRAYTSASTCGSCFLKTLGEKYKVIQLFSVRLFLSWGFWFAKGFPLIGMGFSSPSFPDQLLIWSSDSKPPYTIPRACDAMALRWGLGFGSFQSSQDGSNV